VRWVNTKEEHAGRILEMMSEYMLAQRVKPPADANGPKQDQYVGLLLVMRLSVVGCFYGCAVVGLRVGGDVCGC